MGEFLSFAEVKDTGKTKVWSVTSKESGYVLCFVKWRTGWRKYVFAPCNDTQYDSSCMDEISEFMKVEMAKRKM